MRTFLITGIFLEKVLRRTDCPDRDSKKRNGSAIIGIATL